MTVEYNSPAVRGRRISGGVVKARPAKPSPHRERLTLQVAASISELDDAKHDYKGEGERAYQLGKELGDGFVLEADLRRNLDDGKKR